MEEFIKNMDPRLRKAGDEFIRRIREGILTKKHLPNHSEEYPLQTASDSFEHFLDTDSFNILLGKKEES